MNNQKAGIACSRNIFPSRKFYSPIRGGATSFARPPTNCRIDKVFGRSATPIKKTATMVNTVFAQPSNKHLHCENAEYLRFRSAASPHCSPHHQIL